MTKLNQKLCPYKLETLCYTKWNINFFLPKKKFLFYINLSYRVLLTIGTQLLHIFKDNVLQGISYYINLYATFLQKFCNTVCMFCSVTHQIYGMCILE